MKINRLLVLPISLMLLIVFNTAFADCGDDDMIFGVQNLIDRARVAHQIPGIEVTINCPKNKGIYDFVSGTTLLNENRKVQIDSLFQVGSETKSIVAVLLLQMEAEGLLSLDDTIDKWLPNINPLWHDITLKQLLNHTSGLFNHVDVLFAMAHRDKNYDYDKLWTPNELLYLILDKPFYFQPGQGWHYSNTNYLLAGMVIEAVSGKSLAEEIKSRITIPLQLSNSYYLPNKIDESIKQRMAHGYATRGYFPDEPKDITDINLSWANAAGAMISTSHDMAIWFRNLTDGSLLPVQQMKELMTLVDQEKGLPLSTESYQGGYGLGIIHSFDTFNEEAWWHSGGTLGYTAMMVWLKSNDIVLTVNMSHMSATGDIYIVTQDLAAYLQKSNQFHNVSIKTKLRHKPALIY